MATKKTEKNELTEKHNLPILYTDNINLSVNSDGVILDITQRNVNTKDFTVVTRVGMSREHAKKFVDKLAQLLVKTSFVNQRKKNLN